MSEYMLSRRRHLLGTVGPACTLAESPVQPQDHDHVIAQLCRPTLSRPDELPPHPRKGENVKQRPSLAKGPSSLATAS